MASQLGLASGSVPGLEPESALESAWVPGLASGSVPGLEPESVPVWEQDSDLVLASVMPMALQASDSAWVPESVWARESASELGEDRNQRHLQPLSLPLLRLLPRIYPGK